jgi:pre-mRNA-processing factor 6
MLAQHHTEAGNAKKATDTYKQAIGKCPNAVDLWCCYARFEKDNTKGVARPRSILEMARLKNPANATLWLAAVRIEEAAGSETTAQQLMAKALQECPSAGYLWAHAIASDARPLRKARSYDALKRCSDDPHVFMAVAKLFWMDRKIKKVLRHICA